MRHGGLHFSVKSVNLWPCRRRLVILEKAKIVFSRILAFCSSCAITFMGVSCVPAVSDPSSSINVPWDWLITFAWSHRSSNVVSRVCM